MSSNNDAILSKTIMFLRFPLITAVVLIHTSFSGLTMNGTLWVSKGQFPVYDLVYHVVSGKLACIAVPLFFFISGFLFFYHSDFSKEIYREKLKKRIRTLVIPYIFWNIVVALLFLLVQLFLPSMTSGMNKPFIDYDWLDWLNLFWGYPNGSPICYQFWFIRDLMVVIIFTPVVYCFIKYCKVLSVIAFGVLWLLNLWSEVPVFSTTAFFFFSLGAWFSIGKRDFTVDFRSMRWIATFVYVVLIALDTWLWKSEIADVPYLHKIGIVVGIVAVVSWTAYGIKGNYLQSSTFLAGSSFFVYAYHGMPLTLVLKCWVKLLSPVKEWMILWGYLLIPFFIVGMGVCIYALLRKHFPTLTALVTGGR